ncbi:peroxide stress protein YaaA [Botrimarina hoheduenensis]|uniref:UPF0246 protein Pla111_00140 n=1 Tax=Botrimarina hoheduenensis TaxID=2528000 RepID=A0A5C5WDP1_9BACT|nr:peroxide stress protein YaaA [Botrimarina hoheduenensis]TWT48253.1 hypothetical protein Pla111_00140 [Botrimarina hoheduenensis]
MLIVLSPAKTLDFSPTPRKLGLTKPVLHAEAKQLAAVAQQLSQPEIAQLMELSERLAETAHGYLQNWKGKWDAKGTKPALLAFQGDVYQGLQADSLTDKQLDLAQKRLRILSGLYGVLRPLDLIQPYRLEMGRRLKTPRGASLYDWWKNQVSDSINRDLAEATPRGAEPLVVNLASNEYWSVVQPERLDARVVTPVFKERKGEGFRIVSFFAKRARGAMARHLLTCRQRGEAAIHAFSKEGYGLNAELSQPGAPVFTRDSSG